MNLGKTRKSTSRYVFSLRIFTVFSGVFTLFYVLEIYGIEFHEISSTFTGCKGVYTGLKGVFTGY